MSKNNNKNQNLISNYKYGFNTKTTDVVSFKPGLSEDVVRNISKIKGEPNWMLEIRLKALEKFYQLQNPTWGPDLQFLNFNDYTYFIKSTDAVASSWEQVPQSIKDTFSKIGIPEAEQKYLSGVTTQFESEAVYHSTIEELQSAGVIFMDTDSALKQHEDIFKKYFAKLVSYDDNKYAALNTAVWSGGSFIYVPKNTKIKKPLQSYFRINSERMGQFERTLIIVEDESTLNYVEGCTAPIYTNNSLHAAVVEIYVGKNAKCRYSTIQNWSTNVVNLVTKRAIVDDFGTMEWIDGNIGSGLNMKYPACILKGKGSHGNTISIAFANASQLQDAGCKMIHLGEGSTSNIVSKSICTNGGTVNYRGLVKIEEAAKNSKSHIQCDTLMLDQLSHSDTIPTNIVLNGTSVIEHEASAGKIDEDQLYYLMSRGLTSAEATELIVMGFIEPFARELPMEYAVELNQLLKLNMDGSIG